ncbi:MAG: FAD-dependent oxidoreductase [Rhodospirillales bacterium]|nr:FAD-dependent oxidoreductase [Rhodospirillales bacterium]
MKAVILGAGPAGVTAAETIRAHHPKARITLVGDEPHPPYGRMAIPYLLSGRIDEAGTHLRADPDHYRNLGLTLKTGRAVGLDAKARTLALEQGELAYDALLIATGAKPVKPKIKGLNLPGVHHCWTLADARAIAALARKGEPVVLMGAGFIGTIILEALALRGVSLTVVEQADRMVPRMMDAKAGALLKRWCQAQGVKVLTGTSIAGVEKGPKGLAVTLSGGKTIPAALLVVAAGVAPNIGFLKGSGVKAKQGLLVDAHLETSLPGIFAAGDVAQGLDFTTGALAVNAIQPGAVAQGRLAGLNMAGERVADRGQLAMNVLDTLGLVSASFGAWDGVEGGWRSAALDRDNFRYTRLEFLGDRLVGANLVGIGPHVGMVRGLIETGTRLGAWAKTLKRDPNRLPEAYVATLAGRRD